MRKEQPNERKEGFREEEDGIRNGGVKGTSKWCKKGKKRGIERLFF